MRRGHRQRTSGAENDWINRGWRDAFRLWKRPGRGKYSKKQMARRRRKRFETKRTLPGIWCLDVGIAPPRKTGC